MNFDWTTSFPHAVTVCDTDGIIIAMNAVACENFKKYGGGKLLGSSLFDCHPESANELIHNQLASKSGNTYITEHKDKKRLISQQPWFDGEQFGGLVETIINLPLDVPIKKR